MNKLILKTMKYYCVLKKIKNEVSLFCLFKYYFFYMTLSKKNNRRTRVRSCKLNTDVYNYCINIE